jgi:hypothetical protein
MESIAKNIPHASIQQSARAGPMAKFFDIEFWRRLASSCDAGGGNMDKSGQLVRSPEANGPLPVRNRTALQYLVSSLKNIQDARGVTCRSSGHFSNRRSSA